MWHFHLKSNQLLIAAETKMDVELLRIFRPGSTPLVSLTYKTSLAILLGTPVQLFVNLSLTGISNHTAAA